MPDHDLKITAAQLAELLSASKRSVNRLCEESRWFADELPAPIEGSSPRRWRLADVEAWMIWAEQLN